MSSKDCIFGGIFCFQHQAGSVFGGATNLTGRPRLRGILKAVAFLAYSFEDKCAEAAAFFLFTARSK